MIDLVIVLAFIVYAVASGFRARRRASQDLTQYFLAGHTLKWWQAGTSMAATQFAADTPLLVTGLVATAGVFAVWRLWVYGLAFLLMAFLFAAHWRRAGVLTDAELTEIRYSGRGVLPLRVLKAVYYGTVINCVVLAMVLVAAVRIAEVFLPWHLWLPPAVFDPIRSLVQAIGVPLSAAADAAAAGAGAGAAAAGAAGAAVSPGAAAVAAAIPSTDVWTLTANNVISIAAILLFTALYSMTGGLRSVVATDVGQFALAMVGTAVYAWIVVAKVGGVGAMTHRVVALYGAEDAARLLSFTPPGGGGGSGGAVGAGWGQALMPFLVVVGLQWLFQMNSDGTGYLAQRSMACRTTDHARGAGVLFAWLQIVFRSLLWLAIAVALLVLFPFTPADAAGAGFAARREMLFVAGIDAFLPPGLRGLMLTGLLAALASTVDTHMNWGASYWANDLYKRLISQRWLGREPGRRELVAVARLSNVVILGIALVVMANLGSIQDAWFISLLFGAGMGSVLVLRWIWERINLWSELAAMATSLMVAPVLLFAVEQEWLRLAVMAVASTSAAVAAALLAPTTTEARRVAFYRRVRPAGWWGRTATAAGDDPARPRRALGRELRATLLGSASLFLALIGLGKLVVPDPGGAEWWIVSGSLLGAVALVPLWWPELRRGSGGA